jgi:hypothetical protein
LRLLSRLAADSGAANIGMEDAGFGEAVNRGKRDGGACLSQLDISTHIYYVLLSLCHVDGG